MGKWQVRLTLLKESIVIMKQLMLYRAWTEEDYFNGSVDYLKQMIRKMTKLPIIRKDFIFTEYQVYEAKVIEADAILLIAAILDDVTFKSYNMT